MDCRPGGGQAILASPPVAVLVVMLAICPHPGAAEVGSRRLGGPWLAPFGAAAQRVVGERHRSAGPWRSPSPRHFTTSLATEQAVVSGRT